DLSNDIVSSTLQGGPKQWRILWQSLLETPLSTQQRLEKVDTQALIALRQKEAEWNSFKPLLESLQVPILLFAGENCFSLKDMKKAKDLIEKSDLFIISDEDHFTLIASMNPVIKRVIRFVKQNT